MDWSSVITVVASLLTGWLARHVTTTEHSKVLNILDEMRNTLARNEKRNT